jgi:hypothetical protein
MCIFQLIQQLLLKFGSAATETTKRRNGRKPDCRMFISEELPNGICLRRFV